MDHPATVAVMLEIGPHDRDMNAGRQGASNEQGIAKSN
jgi:hypothetical protein